MFVFTKANNRIHLTPTGSHFGCDDSWLSFVIGFSHPACQPSGAGDAGR